MQDSAAAAPVTLHIQTVKHFQTQTTPFPMSPEHSPADRDLQSHRSDTAHTPAPDKRYGRQIAPAVLCNQHGIIVNICMAGLPRHFHRPSAIGTFILFGAAVYQDDPDLTVLIKSRQRTFSYGSACFTIKEHAFQGGLNRLPQPFSGWNLVAGETGKPLLMQFPYWGVYNGHQLHFPDSQNPAPGQFLSSPVSGEGSPSAGAAAPSSSVSCGWKKISMMLLSPPGG